MASPQARTHPPRQRGDGGYFPRGTSMLRQVHGERAVGLMYGQRALTIGAIKPLNYIGTAAHSGHKAAPFQRLTRTAMAFETIFFGSRAEADRVLAYVEQMHRRVHGEIREAAGPYPAGTRYDAFDPALMLWTVACIADAALTMHELLVRRLSPEERELLWADYRRFAELFGMERSTLPAAYGEFREYVDQEITAHTSYLTDEARYAGWFSSFAIPSPTLRGPLMGAHNLVVRGSLPPSVRELYGLPWTTADGMAFAALTRSVRAARRAQPAALAVGANTGVFTQIRNEERRRQAAGRPIAHLRPDGTPGTDYPLASTQH